MNKNYDNHTPGYGGSHSNPKEGSAPNNDNNIESTFAEPSMSYDHPVDGHGFKSQAKADDCTKNESVTEFGGSIVGKISPK